MSMTKDQKSVAETLQKPTRRAPWIIGGLSGIALATAAVIAGPAIAANLNPAPTPTPTVIEYHATLTPAEEAAVQQQADAQAAKIAADQKAAADAAAAQAAADAAAKAAATKKSSGWAPGQAPKGTPLPHHTETDPNNGNYGQQTYDDPATFCASRSGSTVNGVPVCD